MIITQIEEKLGNIVKEETSSEKYKNCNVYMIIHQKNILYVMSSEYVHIYTMLQYNQLQICLN